VQSTIVQGGMPTSVQSAPARCEFRGGVEAYCKAAASILSPNGNLVVCVNWQNNQRVYDGACDSGLRVVSVLPVKGREGKQEPLFGVYVLKTICKDNNKGASSRVETEVLPPLSVRNQDGAWTAEYEQVMATMGIPRCP
jgi:tRNA1Val (adenine37-N6)-methyltransferase